MGNGEGERGFTVNVGNRGDIGDGNPVGMEVRFQLEYGKMGMHRNEKERESRESIHSHL